MKALKITGIVIGSLVILFVIAMFAAPTDMEAEVSTTIDAPKEVVYANVSDMRNVDKWFPWYEYDPEMKVTFEGETDQIGSRMHWEGNDDVGKGWQVFTVKEDDRVEKEVHFIEPWENKAYDHIILEEMGGSTKVTWGFQSSMPRPWNVMGLFMNMEEGIKKDFSRGLAKLKSISEEEAMARIAMADQKSPIAINEVDVPERIYITDRKKLNWDEIEGFFEENTGPLMELTHRNGMEIAGSYSGIYYEWDEENKTADMAIAIPVKAVKGDIGKYTTFKAPTGKYMVIDYYGPYEDSGEAHYAMDDYIKEQGYQPSTIVIEEYIVGPAQESDESKYFTKIIYNIVE